MAPLPPPLLQSFAIRCVLPGALAIAAIVAVTWLLSGLDPSLAQNSNPTYALSVDRNTLTERDDATTVKVTATLTSGTAPTSDTTVTLALAGTAVKDTDYSATLPSLTIDADASSGTANVTINPTYDAAYSEGNETIIVTGAATGVTLANSSPITLLDGPFLHFPKTIYVHAYYRGADISITVPEVLKQASGDTVRYSLTKTENVSGTVGLSYVASERALKSTLAAAGAQANANAHSRYTITAADSRGQTAATIISVLVVENQCGSADGWHPLDNFTPSAGLVMDCNLLLAAKSTLWGTTTPSPDWTTGNRIDRWDGSNLRASAFQPFSCLR